MTPLAAGGGRRRGGCVAEVEMSVDGPCKEAFGLDPGGEGKPLVYGKREATCEMKVWGTFRDKEAEENDPRGLRRTQGED